VRGISREVAWAERFVTVPAGAAVRLSRAVVSSLRCPACRSAVIMSADAVTCASATCGRRYPVASGVPVLIDESRSVFRPLDLALELSEGMSSASRGLAAAIRAITPPLDRSTRVVTHLRRLASLLSRNVASPRLLVMGSPDVAERIRSLITGADVVYADVAPSPTVGLLCDPLDLPFENESFDAVVAEGVLQRALDPARSVAEMHRVLKAHGLVYAVVPFVRQTHQGVFDFYRFTHLGVRHLFRSFEEIDSGATSGPGTALAWARRYFWWSFGRSRLTSFVLKTVADWTSFYLAALDRWTIERPRALDGAASVFFLGRRSETMLTSREIIAGYRGAEKRPQTPPGSLRSVSEVFSEWAAAGEDAGMERQHAPAVHEILREALVAIGNRPFTAIDAGCGNGWVVRWLRTQPGCTDAIGVDASASMIAKARATDPEGDYELADLLRWTPPRRVDLVHAMEVLYYLEDPLALLKRMRTHWLRPGGWVALGVDYYQENKESHSWPVQLGLRMTNWSKDQWAAALREAGFTGEHLWYAAPGPYMPGTLAMIAQSPHHESR
jgi:SAM-dependent methyltransferase